MAELQDLRNIGPTLAKRLREIGVCSAQDLRELGAATAYQRIQEKHPENRLSLGHYLYSLEGALQDEDWREFTEKQKVMMQYKAGIKPS